MRLATQTVNVTGRSFQVAVTVLIIFEDSPRKSRTIGHHHIDPFAFTEQDLLCGIRGPYKNFAMSNWRSPQFFYRTNRGTVKLTSTSDAIQWSTLLERRQRTPVGEVAPVNYERTGSLLLRQQRLSVTQAMKLRYRYIKGPTGYQLAKEFGICRNTISQRLEKAGITMRRQPPGSELIDSMFGLCSSGLSLAAVRAGVATSAGIVLHHLLINGVQVRDSHGRKH